MSGSADNWTGILVRLHETHWLGPTLYVAAVGAISRVPISRGCSACSAPQVVPLVPDLAAYCPESCHTSFWTTSSIQPAAVPWPILWPPSSQLLLAFVVTSERVRDAEPCAPRAWRRRHPHTQALPARQCAARPGQPPAPCCVGQGVDVGLSKLSGYRSH